MERPLYHGIWKELSAEKAMVFIAGARQTGKTTLAKMIAGRYENQIVRNWDVPRDRKEILLNPSFFEYENLAGHSKPIVVLDEIHKFRHWKNFLKGAYDGSADRFDFLVLGSGRLDTYQKGGDSLAGRYMLFTLWPFTLAELCHSRREPEEFFRHPLVIDREEPPEAEMIWTRLSERSGFPEPYLAKNVAAYRRWSKGYGRRLVREDIRNLTRIQDLDAVEVLYSLLPERVGSPLSVESLRRDLSVSHKSVQHWLSVFESLFLVRRIRPWSNRIVRAIRKEQKLYLLDSPQIADPAARFENMVALELLRATGTWNDLGLGAFELCYVRNLEKEESDFLIAREGKPWLLIECKLSKDEPSAPFKKFQHMLNCEAVQLVRTPGIHKQFTNGKRVILVCSATRWLSVLP